MELTEFFFAWWYKFMQIKMWLKIFGVGMVKNGFGQSGDGILKLTLSEELTDGITDFLHVDTDSEKLGKLKVNSTIFGWACSKIAMAC